MSEKKLTLMEMAEEFDVTPRTLRYYEYIELLIPEKQGRKRLYGTAEKVRLRLIMRGRRFGFALEQIRQWLELYDPSSQNRKQLEIWIQVSNEQIDELKSRQEELQQSIDEMMQLQDGVREELAKLKE
ncbi:MAG: MerR family DNA-binding transcriptional regulator [Pseudomonadota bacterium]